MYSRNLNRLAIIFSYLPQAYILVLKLSIKLKRLLDVIRI